MDDMLEELRRKAQEGTLTREDLWEADRLICEMTVKLLEQVSELGEHARDMGL